MIGGFVAALLVAGGCERNRDETPQTASTEPEPGGAVPGTIGEEKPDEPAVAENLEDVTTALDQAAEAKVIMEGREQQNLGTIYLLDEDEDVVILGFVNDLEPGVHAIHVHEKGDCSANDFTSAGEHFNPTDTPHAAPFQEQKHVGDLGNLITNEKGTAIFGFRMSGVPLDDSPTSILGKAFIIHTQPDDFTTQPAGGAGERVACGVIRVAPEGQEGQRQMPQPGEQQRPGQQQMQQPGEQQRGE
jgi:Cu-Zn family superoxide dismutase